jgi:molybdenum cofactor biosynthesis enzyme MoaA
MEDPWVRFRHAPLGRGPERVTLKSFHDLDAHARYIEAMAVVEADRLLLYWTGESTRERALMSFDYRPKDVAGAVAHFDTVIAEIQAEHFGVVRPADRTVCKECDFRNYCISLGTIDVKVIS